MTDINETLQQLQSRIDTAQQKRARAQADHDLATKQQDEALATLKEKFGVEDLPSAVALLKEYEADLVTLVDEATKALEEAQA